MLPVPPRRLLPCLLASIFFISLTACDKTREARNQANAVVAASRAAASLGDQAAAMQARTDARRAKGDTLAIPYKDLQAYLPATVAGYQKAGEPQGSMMNMPGMSYSTCAQEYRAGTDENPKNLKVTIVDYNGAAAMYAGATTVLGSGFSMEDDQQRIQSLDLGLKSVKALETYQKQDHRATITAGVADRFFVSVEADQQEDSELVKQVVQQLDLKKLAAL